MKFELRDYIIIIMIIVIIYLLYYEHKNEHFATSPLETQINDTFKADLAPMRLLGTVLTELSNSTGSSLNISDSRFNINKLILNNLNVNGDYNTTDIITNNNVTINHSTFMNFNIDIFPRGMIIAWYNDLIPSGWVLCDGTIYYVDKTTNTYSTVSKSNETHATLTTPNLVDRFILGASTAADVKQIGGESTVSLKFNEMPSHTHTGTKLIEYRMIKRECIDCDSVINHKYPVNDKTVYKYNYISMDPGNEKNEKMVFALTMPSQIDRYKLNQSGPKPYEIGAMPHENMPPFIRLLYIIKV